MSISSDEVNYLVYRYLQESGFTHAAYTFGYESYIQKTSIAGTDLPPGALISFIQKGLQYLELEANLNEDGTDVDGNFSMLNSSDLLSKPVEELKNIVKEKRKSGDDEDRDKEKARVKREKLEADEEANGANGAAPMDADDDVADGAAEAIDDEDVTRLEGHTGEVFICAWSPATSQLASGSGDATARVWSVPAGPSGRQAQGSLGDPIVLVHTPVTDDATEGAEGAEGDEKREFESKDRNKNSKDVTTLDWNGEGSLLATGSYDGAARIWDADGTLVNTLSKHKGPIFSLKWNKRRLPFIRLRG